MDEAHPYQEQGPFPSDESILPSLNESFPQWSERVDRMLRERRVKEGRV
jgi:hypothetical protein